MVSVRIIKDRGALLAVGDVLDVDQDTADMLVAGGWGETPQPSTAPPPGEQLATGQA